jgi:hypothetical protein
MLNEFNSGYFRLHQGMSVYFMLLHDRSGYVTLSHVRSVTFRLVQV